MSLYACAQKTPIKIPTTLHTFALFLAHRCWLNMSVKEMSLSVLSDAALLGRTLQGIQDQMAEIRGELAALKGQSSQSSPSPATSTLAQSQVCTESPEYLPSSRIPGTSWSEEMDIVQPLDGEDTPDTATCSEGARIAEVSEATAGLLKRSFVSIKNEKRLQVRNVYALLKVAVTKAPTLDQVMGSQCSKLTKLNDWSLSRVQALMLDALAPLTEVMEQFNSEAELSSEVIAKAVEDAIKLLGNASSQMSSLRRTRVLQEYNT